MPWPQHELPNLTQANCQITSEAKRAYNCVAWAAGDTRRWWWPIRLPGVNYWPKSAPRELTIEAFVAAYETLGYSSCGHGRPEANVEKIALYARFNGRALTPTHVARQLESGVWTSKLGPCEDVSHITVDDVGGPLYGEVVCYMSRPRGTQ